MGQGGEDCVNEVSFLVTRGTCFKYLGVHIFSDLTWSAHIQIQSKKARQHLYHLRQLRKFRVSPVILRTFYAGAVESILTQNISSWFGNSCVKDQKALQRVIRTAKRCCRTALPSLQDIHTRRCWPRAAQILKDPFHSSNKLFQFLESDVLKTSFNKVLETCPMLEDLLLYPWLR